MNNPHMICLMISRDVAFLTLCRKCQHQGGGCEQKPEIYTEQKTMNQRKHHSKALETCMTFTLHFER